MNKKNSDKSLWEWKSNKTQKTIWDLLSDISGLSAHISGSSGDMIETSDNISGSSNEILNTTDKILEILRKILNLNQWKNINLSGLDELNSPEKSNDLDKIKSLMLVLKNKKKRINKIWENLINSASNSELLYIAKNYFGELSDENIKILLEKADEETLLYITKNHYHNIPREYINILIERWKQETHKIIASKNSPKLNKKGFKKLLKFWWAHIWHNLLSHILENNTYAKQFTIIEKYIISLSTEKFKKQINKLSIEEKKELLINFLTPETQIIIMEKFWNILDEELKKELQENIDLHSLWDEDISPHINEVFKEEYLD